VKKVWCLLGAAGLAPAVGFAMPATTAAAAAHPPKAKTAAKTVSLSPVARHGVRPDITCPSSNVSYVSSGLLRLGVQFSGGACIHHVSGVLFKGHTGLEMRTRIYNIPGGTRVFSNYVHGGLNLLHSETFFNTSPNVYGEGVCIALVESTHHSVVEYGPLCSDY
jgi:hypothetical protein